jgi:uncharacterized membrane protein YuzA (DUF378 family)
MSMLSRLVYVLVGVSALWQLTALFGESGRKSPARA